MSLFVEIVLADPTRLPGLREVLASWGDEHSPFDPPRYAFEGLSFTFVPIPAHVRAKLPAPMNQLERCLELDAEAVYAWARGALEPADSAALGAFVSRAAASTTCAAVVDDSSAPRTELVRVLGSELLEHVGRALSRAGASGMTVFVVESKTS